MNTWESLWRRSSRWRTRLLAAAVRDSRRCGHLQAVPCQSTVHINRARSYPAATCSRSAGGDLLADAPLEGPYRARVNSLCRLIDEFTFEIETLIRLLTARLARGCGYRAVQAVPGVRPSHAAIFTTEIGDVHCFPSPRHLSSWAGLTPRHRASDTTVRGGPIAK